MKEKMRAEGQKRLEKLLEMGLWDEVLRYWEQGTACFSQPMNMYGDQLTGINFTFNEKQKLKEVKEMLEEEKGFLAYYGVYMGTLFGKMLFLFKVSAYEEDWELERNALEKGYADVYCYNLSEQEGEYGSVGFQVADGGITLTE